MTARGGGALTRSHLSLFPSPLSQLLLFCQPFETPRYNCDRGKSGRISVQWSVRLYNGVLTIERHIFRVLPVGHLTSFEIDMQKIILRALIDPGIEVFLLISLTD